LTASMPTTRALASAPHCQTPIGAKTSADRKRRPALRAHRWRPLPPPLAHRPRPRPDSWMMARARADAWTLANPMWRTAGSPTDQMKNWSHCHRVAAAVSVRCVAWPARPPTRVLAPCLHCLARRAQTQNQNQCHHEEWPNQWCRDCPAGSQSVHRRRHGRR
jgi:hypothetical protein